MTRVPPDDRRCAANSKQTGRRCCRWVTDGATVCKWHGGNTPQAVRSAKRRVERSEALAEVRRLGIPIEADPGPILEAMLHEAYGNVTVLRQMVAELGEDIYGSMFHESGRATGEAKPHVLVVMYGEERDRAAKLAETCLKLGLDERRVRAAEAEARRLFEPIGRALTAIPPEYREVFRAALAAELRSRRQLPS